MSRFMLRFSSIALAVGMLVALTAPAHADTRYLNIWYIRCNDQSEPFSDEIRLRVNGEIHGSWNDVDGGEVHWYYSSQAFTSPLNIPFTGDSVFIDILELDDEYSLIGSLEVPAWMVDAGEAEWAATMFDGAYSIRFSVSSTPI
jgi:hypothetical protein